MAKFQAPPIRTPFIGNPPNATFSNGVQNVPSYAWISYFQSITDALSTAAAPATSTSPTTTQFAADTNFLYVAVGPNLWKRVPLNAF